MGRVGTCEVEARSLFQTELNHRDINGDISSKTNNALAQCIADCNGHFRSLENLMVLWARVQHQSLSYSQLIRQLGHQVEDKYSNLKLPHIKAALRGVPVESDAIVPGTTETYGQCLAMGTFLNTPGQVDPTTSSPATNSPATNSPATNSPATNSPATNSPATNSPATSSPATSPHTTSPRTTNSGTNQPCGAHVDTPAWFIPRVSPLQLLLFANKHVINPHSEVDLLPDHFILFILIFS
jgi:hypothetical protein